MLRVTLLARRVSAFSVHMKDIGRQGKLVGSKYPAKVASQSYKRLSPAERQALRKRAERLSYPALDAYNRFQKEFAHRFTHLPNRQRQRKIAALWTELKEKGTVRIPKDRRAPASAAKKVKRAAKKVKRAAKAKSTKSRK